MKLKAGSQCPFHIEEGAMIDFAEDQWIILIKDAIWQPEEIRNFRSRPGLLGFLALDTAVFFTVNVDDVLETSDLPFLIQASEAVDALLRQPNFCVSLALLSQQDEIVAVRELTLGSQETRQIQDSLKRILDAGHSEAVSQRQIEKTQQRYEPYELEEKALFTIKF